jgi:hypothetical protein
MSHYNARVRANVLRTDFVTPLHLKKYSQRPQKSITYILKYCTSFLQNDNKRLETD